MGEAYTVGLSTAGPKSIDLLFFIGLGIVRGCKCVCKLVSVLDWSDLTAALTIHTETPCTFIIRGLELVMIVMIPFILGSVLSIF